MVHTRIIWYYYLSWCGFDMSTDKTYQVYYALLPVISKCICRGFVYLNIIDKMK
jgi:hypothetical protein